MNEFNLGKSIKVWQVVAKVPIHWKQSDHKNGLNRGRTRQDFTTFIQNMEDKLALSSVTSKKSPNVHKSCPKMISLEKLKILTSLQKLPKLLDLG